MNNFKIQELIKAAKTQTGWVYDELPWFSPQETHQAEQVRQDLIRRLGKGLKYSFSGTKPHLGPLAPGCRFCGTPAGIFHFINRACTRTCFFCPEDRTKNPDLQPWTDGLWFENDDVFIQYLQTFHIKSVGFTGGDPLLVKEKLISRMRSIRQQCGAGIQLRLYTNGDLLDRAILQQLHAVGLDEIRLNISARDYALEPVKLARGSGIPVVTVEIPAIPEHSKTVKKAMREMDALGVDYLNLIQLEVTRNNHQALDLKHYHVLPRPTLLPVFESEICSLELMLFRQENHLRLPVSYCGFPYRFEVSNAQRSRRYNQFDLKGWEELTEAGFIRTWAVAASERQFKKIVAQLAGADDYAGLWHYHPDGTELVFHRKLFPAIMPSCPRIRLRYSEQTLAEFSLNSMEWKKNILAETELSSPSVRCWQQLYLEHRNARDAFRSLVGDYPLNAENPSDLLQKEIRFLKKAALWEEPAANFPGPLF